MKLRRRVVVFLTFYLFTTFLTKCYSDHGTSLWEKHQCSNKIMRVCPCYYGNNTGWKWSLHYTQCCVHISLYPNDIGYIEFGWWNHSDYLSPWASHSGKYNNPMSIGVEIFEGGFFPPIQIILFFSFLAFLMGDLGSVEKPESEGGEG